MRRTLLLVALVPLAVGCGAAPSSSPGLGGAPEKMVAAGSSRISVSYGGKQFFAGEFDFKRNVGSFAWGTTKRDAEWDQILASDATYTRIPRELFPGSSNAAWLKLGAGSKGQPPFGFGPSDPARLLDLLKAASSVHQVKSGEERGVPVARYRATLDLERALRELPDDERAAFRALIRQYWVDGAEKGIPLDLAVDYDGLLRRVDITIPEGQELTVEFFDYGLDVVAKPPPSDQVVTLEELVRLQFEHCSENEEGTDDPTACVNEASIHTWGPTLDLKP
jgi:hypothetical protein